MGRDWISLEAVLKVESFLLSLKRMTLTCSSADMPGMEDEDELGHGLFAPFPPAARA
jgi:hypothetical protein